MNRTILKKTVVMVNGMLLRKRVRRMSSIWTNIWTGC